MLKNYFIVAWRNLLRNPIFSLVNIAGLAIGLAVGFLICQYVRFERSYDRFHRHAERLYRVPLENVSNVNPKEAFATNHPALGPALKQEFPEVQAFARLVRTSLFMNALSLSYDGESAHPIAFNETRMYLADAPFLTMFSFPFKEGKPEQALKEPGSITLSESMAKKYFGNQPALGKQLRLNRRMNLTVTGVFRDLPPNSHLQFDALLSIASLGSQWGGDNWTWPEFYNYVLLKPGADPQALQAKLPAFTKKYLGKINQQYQFHSRLFLQPATDIHLKSDLVFEQDVNGSERMVYFLSLLAGFVLLIAGINYVNLSTARSLKRSREVGLRKVVGASKAQLIIQFFFDALLVNLFAVLLALLLLLIGLPAFEQLIGKPLSQVLYASGIWQSLSLWALAGGAMVGGTLLVGLYPAFLLSSFHPAQVLKGNFHHSPSGILLRKCLVAFQYGFSLVLLAGTILIYRQLTYMQAQDLGYQKEQVLVLRSPAVYDSTLTTRMQYFENELGQLPAIDGMAASDDIPGQPITQRNVVRRPDQQEADDFDTNILAIDASFLPTLGISLAAGRNFRENERFAFQEETGEARSGPLNKVLINEDVSRKLGYVKPADALHQRIVFRLGQEYVGEVIGVVKNYHQVSLRENYAPILYFYPPNGNWKYFSLRVNTQDLSTTLASVEKSYAKAFPNNAFEYFFLDEYFDNQYRADQRFGAIFGIFTLLAIVIACLGLVGLSVFAVTQRTREVGIRKVLGASVTSILLLFSRDSLRLLLVCYGIVVPVIYLVASNWLKNFAFRISLSWEVFLLPILFLLVLSVSTICLIAWKAAVSNPVESLRHE